MEGCGVAQTIVTFSAFVTGNPLVTREKVTKIVQLQRTYYWSYADFENGSGKEISYTWISMRQNFRKLFHHGENPLNTHPIKSKNPTRELKYWNQKMLPVQRKLKLYETATHENWRFYWIWCYNYNKNPHNFFIEIRVFDHLDGR